MKELDKELDIVIPVYNEGENIVETLIALKQSVKTSFRVLICYDFNEDNTLPAVRDARGAGCDVQLVKNRGKGVHHAIMTGLGETEADAVLMYPADESYNTVIIDAMYTKLREGNDVVGASRFMKGGAMKGGPFLKSLVLRAAAFTLKRFGGLGASDASYALKMFSRRILDTVEIESTDGFTFAIELLVKCHRLGWKAAEVPARWLMREKGQSRFNFRKWLPHYFKWFLYAFATTYLRRGSETVKLKSGAEI
ncbi:hypothetical protein A2110_03015 [Candidatus Jorgensenbacteria bacterium GWA1_54_12]|uniref:Glycosyltransferase 2-like domain-containing protein n=1 Tax=Candidatus Jorgensenbacteria bacterium GWA1_54_12 TaxID=1798468 RepID=A0A1F6BKT2_9BACT|nr:MAG: hypothetical protein UY51_C0002G0002 [Candidatus Jorgensenbacteria bacterium GW2011_GWB1_49_9]OGG37529.1 MAG: hypothetical protein A2110_03015 [Candidatus Jorgensenbacteria bacterium GWA1_54_12]